MMIKEKKTTDRLVDFAFSCGPLDENKRERNDRQYLDLARDLK